MSNYVFTNPEKTKKLYAKECNISHKYIKYYCQTPNCPARLTLKSMNGKRDPYFSALPSSPHDESICSCGRIPKNRTNYDVSNFSIESLYNSVISKQNINDRDIINPISPTHPTNNLASEKITTPSKLYYYCKAHDISHVINNIKIKNLIADSRTNFIFTRAIYGFKLVESKFSHFSDLNNSIKVTYSVNLSDRNHHKLTLNFNNSDDYNRIKSKLFNRKKHYSSVFIVILGNWNNNECTIEHWKQIVLI